MSLKIYSDAYAMHSYSQKDPFSLYTEKRSPNNVSHQFKNIESFLIAEWCQYVKRLLFFSNFCIFLRFSHAKNW